MTLRTLPPALALCALLAAVSHARPPQDKPAEAGRQDSRGPAPKPTTKQEAGPLRPPPPSEPREPGEDERRCSREFREAVLRMLRKFELDGREHGVPDVDVAHNFDSRYFYEADVTYYFNDVRMIGAELNYYFQGLYWRLTNEQVRNMGTEADLQGIIDAWNVGNGGASSAQSYAARQGWRDTDRALAEARAGVQRHLDDGIAEENAERLAAYEAREPLRRNTGESELPPNGTYVPLGVYAYFSGAEFRLSRARD